MAPVLDSVAFLIPLMSSACELIGDRAPERSNALIASDLQGDKRGCHAGVLATMKLPCSTGLGAVPRLVVFTRVKT
ncbi:hypothetical protein LY76DRAFT_81589 [Colletotrichum caudatum]|nr:hypothetical protein LY76DRAFT_81589 [Colletotrichum caudatum]